MDSGGLAGTNERNWKNLSWSTGENWWISEGAGSSSPEEEITELGKKLPKQGFLERTRKFTGRI